MDNWQFFLQKEGDNAWLPLETPQVEILEGRYQLIAHTQAVGQTVQVKIRHRQDIDNIMQETCQENDCLVQEPGKVEILSDLYLGLGSWQISCHLPKAVDGRSTDSIRHDLEIQVLPQDFDLFEAWEFIESQHHDEPQPLKTSVLMPHPPIVVEESLVPVVAEAIEIPQLELEPLLVAPSSHPQLPAETDFNVEFTASESEKFKGQNNELAQSEPFTQSVNSSKTPCLPVLPKTRPQISFRTVQPQQLPRLVSDKGSMSASTTRPELPAFTRGRSVAILKRQTRQRTIERMKVIATVMATQAQSLPQNSATSRLHDTLNQLAIADS